MFAKIRRNKVIITFVFLIFSLSSCTNKATLEVPSFDSLTKIEYVYTDTATSETYSVQVSIYSDSSVPSYYEDLNEAKYQKKIDENKMLEVPNIMMVLTINDSSKVTYTIYQEDSKTYLEDNENLNLYTISDEVYNTIVKNIELNH